MTTANCCGAQAVAKNPAFHKREVPLMTPLVLASVQHPEHWRIYLLAKAHAFTTGDSCNITNNADVIVAIAHERAGDLPGAPAAARRAR